LVRPVAFRKADEVIIELAEAQHGLAMRTQLLQAGVSRHVIDRRVKLGQLRKVHAGVYQVGVVSAPRAREMAALLVCRGGVVSHVSAAVFWEMLPAESVSAIDVTLPPNLHARRRPGIRAHRQRMAKDEITVVDRIAVTTPARTILDISRNTGARDLERAIACAERSDPDVRDGVRALMHRYAATAGTRLLRTFIASAEPAALTRSDAEERVLTMIRLSGLPTPEMNCVVRGFEVDCYWRQARLVVEVDGFAFHRSRGAFVRDRQRDSALAAAGIRVLRLSWHQLVNEHDRTLVQLAQALARAEA
jgi:very-short-patch-repair endonuclease